MKPRGLWNDFFTFTQDIIAKDMIMEWFVISDSQLIPCINFFTSQSFWISCHHCHALRWFAMDLCHTNCHQCSDSIATVAKKCPLTPGLVGLFRGFIHIRRFPERGVPPYRHISSSLMGFPWNKPSSYWAPPWLWKPKCPSFDARFGSKSIVRWSGKDRFLRPEVSRKTEVSWNTSRNIFRNIAEDWPIHGSFDDFQLAKNSTRSARSAVGFCAMGVAGELRRSFFALLGERRPLSWPRKGWRMDDSGQ